MNHLQRLHPSVEAQRPAHAGRSLYARLKDALYTWRLQRMLRLALRQAEQPNLVLDISADSPRLWPVLLEHRNRIVVCAPNDAEALQERQRQLPVPMLERICLLAGPFDASELKSDAVDCVIASCTASEDDDPASRNRLQELQRITRDTLILFVHCPRQRTGQNLFGRQRQQCLAAGFQQVGYYDLVPGLEGLRVYILRKRVQRESRTDTPGVPLRASR